MLELGGAERKAALFLKHDLEEAIALADRIVMMSAGPEARIIGDHPVPIPRPRDIHEVRLTATFLDIHRSLWHKLRSAMVEG